MPGAVGAGGERAKSGVRVSRVQVTVSESEPDHGTHGAKLASRENAISVGER